MVLAEIISHIRDHTAVQRAYELDTIKMQRFKPGLPGKLAEYSKYMVL